MITVSVTDARSRLPEILEHSKTEAVLLERHGRPAAVVLSPEQYEKMLEALEGAEDAAAFDAAIAEEGDNIPWAQVKSDLGWE